MFSFALLYALCLLGGRLSSTVLQDDNDNTIRDALDHFKDNVVRKRSALIGHTLDVNPELAGNAELDLLNDVARARRSLSNRFSWPCWWCGRSSKYCRNAPVCRRPGSSGSPPSPPSPPM